MQLYLFTCAQTADWAVQNNRQAIVKLLLERVEGLDVLARNKFGRGPLTDAFDVGNTDTGKLMDLRYLAGLLHDAHCLVNSSYSSDLST